MDRPRPKRRRVASQPARPAPRGGRLILRYGLLGGLLVMAALASKIGFMYWQVRDEEGSKTKLVARRLFEEVVGAEVIFGGRSRVNILLIVEDITLDNRRQRIKGYSRSDTNILIGLDRIGNRAGMLSLPRDTLVQIPSPKAGGGWQKLNAAHAYGGPWLLVETIQENLHVEVHHYVKTNAEGFVKLVDLVDGVEIDVERDMDYDDNWQDFHVHLKKGLQHLDGKEAEGYVRWRKNKRGGGDPKGDLGRIERQQKVMEALLKKVLSPRYLPRLRSMLRAARACVETDLSDRQLASLVAFMSRFDPANLQKATLPTGDGASSVPIAREQAAPLLQSLFGETFDYFAFSGEPNAPASATGRLSEPTPSPLRELEEPTDEWAKQPENEPAEGESAEPDPNAPEELPEGLAEPPQPPAEEVVKEPGWAEPPAGEPPAEPGPPADQPADKPEPELAPGP